MIDKTLDHSHEDPADAWDFSHEDPGDWPGARRGMPSFAFQYLLAKGRL
jgi:hypothetical protein